MTVLIIEHNDYLATRLAQRFEKSGFDVELMRSGADAGRAIGDVSFALVVIDAEVPDVSAPSFIQAMRARRDRTPVIVLAGDEQTVRQAVDAGADDSLKKPVDLGELIARARRLERGVPNGGPLSLANLVVDPIRHEVIIGDRTRKFTSSEVEVLEQLLSRRGRLIPKDVLQQAIYGSRKKSGAIEVLVHRVRKRLHEAGARVEIQTMRRLGYLIDEAR